MSLPNTPTPLRTLQQSTLRLQRAAGDRRCTGGFACLLDVMLSLGQRASPQQPRHVAKPGGADECTPQPADLRRQMYSQSVERSTLRRHVVGARCAVQVESAGLARLRHSDDYCHCTELSGRLIRPLTLAANTVLLLSLPQGIGPSVDRHLTRHTLVQRRAAEKYACLFEPRACLAQSGVVRRRCYQLAAPGCAA